MGRVQTSFLDRSLILVHASADAGIAAELADFLGRALPVRVNSEEGLVSSTLGAAFQEALSADDVIVLLSKSAVVRRGSGPEWEATAAQAAQTGVRTACLWLEDCVSPAVLRRVPAFDGRENRLAAFRAVKRWLLEPVRALATVVPPEVEGTADGEELEGLRRRLVDVPGSMDLPCGGAALLRQLVRDSVEEFEAVVWIDCQWRTAENFVAELGEQLGLVLGGPWERNLAALRGCLARRRVLVALENFRRLESMPSLPFGEGCSVITTAPGVVTLPDAGAVLRDLRAWRSDAVVASRALTPAGALVERIGEMNWEVAREVGRLAGLVARRNGRNDEAYRLLDRLQREALRHRDRELAFDSARERAWIAQEWGEAAEFPSMMAAEPEQISLFG